MSFFSKTRLTRDKWIAPTRREIGYGMQFAALGIAIGYGWGAVAYLQSAKHPSPISIVVVGLILIGGRILRS